MSDIIVRVFIVMSIGFTFKTKFTLYVQTLARLNIYYVVPAFIFVRLYEAVVPWNMFAKVILFVAMLVAILYVISMLTGTLLGLDARKKVTFTNSVIFYNSGNYAVAVTYLVFSGDSSALSFHCIIVLFHIIFIFLLVI